MKGVIGTGVSGSKGEGPGTVNIQREPLLSAVNIFKYYLRVGHERYGGERNDRKGERKDRETPRGKENGGRAWWSREAARARSSSATHSSRQHTRCRLALPRGMDPESFTYEEKESYVRFAPFMGMRSCALEPRSEMQGGWGRGGALATLKTFILPLVKAYNKDVKFIKEQQRFSLVTRQTEFRCHLAGGHATRGTQR